MDGQNVSYDTDNKIVYLNHPEDDLFEKDCINKCLNISKLENLNRCLYQSCPSCRLCNSVNRFRSIPNGSFDADYMFVDLYPNDYEVIGGCFTERKGYLINQALKSINKNRNDLYCTELIKCNNTKEFDNKTIYDCINNNFIDLELFNINPKVLILTLSAYKCLSSLNLIEPINNGVYFNCYKRHIYNYNDLLDVYICYDFDDIFKSKDINNAINFFIKGISNVII